MKVTAWSSAWVAQVIFARALSNDTLATEVFRMMPPGNSCHDASRARHAAPQSYTRVYMASEVSLFGLLVRQDPLLATCRTVAWLHSTRVHCIRHKLDDEIRQAIQWCQTIQWGQTILFESRVRHMYLWNYKVAAWAMLSEITSGLWPWTKFIRQSMGAISTGKYNHLFHHSVRGGPIHLAIRRKNPAAGQGLWPNAA